MNPIEILTRNAFERKVEQSDPVIRLHFTEEDEIRYRIFQAYQLRVPYPYGVVTDIDV